MRNDSDTLFYNALRFHNLSRLSPGLLHDLRSPLNAIVMNLELLRHANAAQEERLQRYLQAIDRAVERLEAFVGLLEERTAPETDVEVDLGILFAKLERCMDTPARLRQVELHIAAPATRLKIKDGTRVQEILLALALAALEASPAQGMLTVEAEANAGSVSIAIRAIGADPASVGCHLHAARRLLETRGIAIEMTAESDAECRLHITVPLAQTPLNP